MAEKKRIGLAMCGSSCTYAEAFYHAEKLAEKYVFCEQQRMDEAHRAVRFCTSWATREDAVEALCADLRLLLGKN